ncbi:MAG: glycosyltransferase [Elusimicrobia bacterium]|nr:glycosyltransferase [Elusimicrobiota bacterium]
MVPQRRKIVFVITSTTIGGAEKTLYILATHLKSSEFEVATVISLKPLGPYAAKLQESGIAVETLNMSRIPSPKDLLKLAQLRKKISRLQPNIVHAFMYRAIQFCRTAKIGNKFKLLSSPRINYRTRSLPLLWLDRCLKEQDDLTITESNSSRDFFVKNLGYDPRKVSVIYNGLAVSHWNFSPSERTEYRKRLGLESNQILIGCVGRLDAQKGQETLLKALIPLKDRYPLKAILMGDGPMKEGLRLKVKGLNLENVVYFTGEQQNIQPWLSGMDIFVLPSLWEGTPNALLEAMALGLPCVASSVDGVTEVLEDGKSGLLVPPGDSAKLSEALERLIQDSALRQRLGAAAKQRISEKFTLQTMLDAYLHAYRSLIA